MKYYCSNCHYYYDEDFWDEAEWIYGTFDELPSYFCCPVCWNNKENFITLKKEIIYFDKNKLSNIEKEHYPKLKLNWEKLSVSLNHDSNSNHYISKIVLLDNMGDTIETCVLWAFKENICIFDIEYIDEFEIQIFCNKHPIFSTWLIKREDI